MQWWDRLNMILIIFAENCPMFEFSGRHCIGDAVRENSICKLNILKTKKMKLYWSVHWCQNLIKLYSFTTSFINQPNIKSPISPKSTSNTS